MKKTKTCNCYRCGKITKLTEDGYCENAATHDLSIDPNPVFEVDDYVWRLKITKFIHVWPGEIRELLPNGLVKVEWLHYLGNGSAFSIISTKKLCKRIGPDFDSHGKLKKADW